jgi:V8-like Glu-specific endopeptidase
MPTAHLIEQSTVLSEGHCSATAVGPHALLTASHCEEPTDEIYVDGKKAKVEGILRDGNDHSFLLLSGVAFDKTAELASRKQEVGDEIEIVGNPANHALLYRAGHVSGYEFGFPPYFLYDINAFFGDSGAGIFHDGRIVGVISFLRVEQGEGGTKFTLAGGFELSFTDQQIAVARTY